MLQAIFVLILLVGAGFGVWALSDNPGEVLVNWHGYEVETTALFALLVVFLLTIFMVVMTRIWVWAERLPSRLHAYLEKRREIAGMDALLKGLNAVAAGEKRKAVRFSRMGEKKLAYERLIEALGAQAAALTGDLERATEHYEYLADEEKTRLIGLHGLIDIARMKGDWPHVQQLALQAVEAAPKGAWAQGMLYEAYVRNHQFLRALEVLPKLRKLGKRTADEVAFDGASLHTQLAQQLSHQDTEAALEHAEKACDMCPPFVPAALLAADLYVFEQKHDKARKILAKAWAVCPHEVVFTKFLEVSADIQGKALYKATEKFAGRHKEYQEGQYALGLVAMENNNYKQAQEHLEKAFRLGGEREVYEALAKLERGSEGGSRKAMMWYEKALEAPKTMVKIGSYLNRYRRWCRRHGLVYKQPQAQKETVYTEA